MIVESFVLILRRYNSCLHSPWALSQSLPIGSRETLSRSSFALCALRWNSRARTCRTVKRDTFLVFEYARFTGEVALERSIMGCLVLAGRFNQPFLYLVVWLSSNRSSASRTGRQFDAWGSIDKECGTLANLKMKVGSLLYNVWRPQYNPEVLRACVSSRGAHESCLERWISREHASS